ncbi:hypothetical protein [Amycolatopsis sp.]|jgi:hypothetical protein|uniref:hypothetical protein n=1 Tax=Amycolatopsis sp. TaxID=37632 RepID=UPI002E0B8BED|nr:hypothetical protein [Amycolatopsis sp.]
MVSGGFEVKSAPLIEFGNHLDELEGNLKSTGSLLQGCVTDVGLFGLVGQLFGAGASTWCDKAQKQFSTYADTIGGFSDKIREAAKKYEAGETDAGDAIVGAAK